MEKKITLYRPVKSSRRNKKFDVFVKGKNGKPKKISFGDSRYDDFRTHKDPKRRESYRKRARGIRNKEGKLTYLDKNTANYWSYNYLWK